MQPLRVLANSVHLLVAVLCAFCAGFSAFFLGFFTLNVIVPISVDYNPEWHNPPAIQNFPSLNNSLLMVLFFAQHSIFARQFVKDIFSLFLPKELYRQFYVLVASASIVLLVYCWKPMPAVVWELKSPLSYAIWGLSAVCVLLLIASCLSMPSLEFIGIQQPLKKFLNRRTSNPPQLIDTGLYGLIRHPMYTFTILSLWIVPKMTLGHLFLAVNFTAYVVLAVTFCEEPGLIKEFGSGYIKYMERVPRFFPVPWLRATHKN